MNDKEFNLWVFRTGAIVGSSINLIKKISAYVKKNNLKFDKIEEYLLLYDNVEFDEFICEQYDIKGEVTPLKIMMASKKDCSKVSEHDEQVKVVKYLESKKIKFFAVPNGFIFNGDKKSTAKYINYMTAEGLRRGAYDLVILPGNGKTAFLEMKTKTGTVSDKQKEWKKFFDDNGYTNKIAYGYEDAKSFIDELIGE